MNFRALVFLFACSLAQAAQLGNPHSPPPFLDHVAFDHFRGCLIAAARNPSPAQITIQRKAQGNVPLWTFSYEGRGKAIQALGYLFLPSPGELSPPAENAAARSALIKSGAWIALEKPTSHQTLNVRGAAFPSGETEPPPMAIACLLDSEGRAQASNQLALPDGQEMEVPTAEAALTWAQFNRLFSFPEDVPDPRQLRFAGDSALQPPAGTTLEAQFQQQENRAALNKLPPKHRQVEIRCRAYAEGWVSDLEKWNGVENEIYAQSMINARHDAVRRCLADGGAAVQTCLTQKPRCQITPPTSAGDPLSYKLRCEAEASVSCGLPRSRIDNLIRVFWPQAKTPPRCLN